MKTNFLKLSAAIVAVLLIVACVPVMAFAAGSTTASKTGSEMATALGVSNAGSVDGQNISLDNAISVRFDQGTASTPPTYYDSGSAIRMYQKGAKLTVSAAPGCQITSIVITVADDEKAKGAISVTGGTAAPLSAELQHVITVNSGVSEVVIATTGTTSSDRCYVAGISVTYTGTAPATPFVPEVEGPKEVTLAEAKALEDGTKVIVKGTVTEVETTSYGTYSVTITDASGDTLYIYSMKTAVTVGDIITVTGNVGSYEGEKQIAAGSTAEITGKDPSVQPEQPEQPDTPVNPDTSDAAWVVTTQLKNGDKVLIGAATYGKLLSVLKVNETSYYNLGVDYSATDFSNVTDNETFVVTVNGDGSYTFTSVSGKVIALADSYSSLNDTGANKNWTLTANGDGTFLVKNTGRSEGLYLEWYDSKGNWSTYSAGNTPEYYISFYVKNENTDTPVQPEPPVVNDPEADSTLTIEEALALGASKGNGVYTTGKYYVTGVIASISNTTFGNMKIQDEAGNLLTVYGTWSADGSDRYDAMAVQPAVGDTITVYGVIGKYNSKPQLKDGWITAHVSAEEDTTEAPEVDETTEAPVVEDPTEGPDAPVVTDAPDVEDPTEGTDAPVVTDAPDAEDPTEGTDAPVATDAPVVEDPTEGTNAPVATDAPVVEDPTEGTDAPVVEDPTEAPDAPVVTDAPVVEDPTEAPDATDATDAPVVEDPTEVPDAPVVTEAPDVPDETEPEDKLPEDGATLTIEQAIAIGGAMEHNTFTSQKYYVTGVITEVYNTQYGNMKLVDANGNILTIYGSYSADGADRYDAMAVQPVAGDTVTIYGILGQYNGNPQIKNGWIVEHVAAGEETDPETNAPETNAPETNAPETNAPATNAPEEPTTEAGEGNTTITVGCGSVAGLGAMAIVAVAAVALVSFKKKED